MELVLEATAATAAGGKCFALGEIRSRMHEMQRNVKCLEECKTSDANLLLHHLYLHIFHPSNLPLFQFGEPALLLNHVSHALDAVSVVAKVIS